MKIRTKIFSIFLLTGLILLVVGVSSFYYFSARILKNQIFDELSVLTQAKVEHIQFYIREHQLLAELISRGVIFKDLLSTPKEHPNYQAVLAKVNERFEDIIKSRSDIDEICLLDNKGINVVSTIPECIGQDRSQEEAFIKGKDAIFIKDVHLAEDGRKILIVSAPVKNDDNFLGVIVFEINLNELFQVIGSRTGLGETGEFYLINQDSYMISPSRFIEDVILKEKIDTVNARNCLSVKPHSLEYVGHKPTGIFEDYRGINVLGAHAYIPEMDWCLLAEINENESLLPVRNMLRTSIIIGIIILFFIYLIANFVGKTISKPIMKLHRGAEVVAGGNLDYKVGTNRKDEIGQLSRAFDRMTVAIKKSRVEVDAKVAKQTKEIRQKNTALEDQQKAILNILEDVRLEKENTTKERDKINIILYSIGDGVFVVDKNYKIILFNQMAANISGFLKQEVIGKRYDEVLKFVYEQNNVKNDKFIIDSLNTGKVKKMSNHTVLIRKDGKKVPVADSAAPLKDKNGDITGCVVVFHDVTKERQIDRAKSEFVSLASHQLRTPLTTISWFTELLLDEKVGKLSKKQKEHLREVYQGNRRMIELVSALLNVSRIELGTLAIEPKLIDLKRVVDVVVKELSPQIKEKKIDIKKEIDENLSDIKADPNLTKIIFQNIVSNAVKYTPTKGKIRVSLVKKESNVLFKVKDTGYGIPKEQQPKIFTKLFRADNIVEKEPDGTGLGLYIVKAVINQAGGKVWFESEENKGTTFYIALPLEGMKRKTGTKGLSPV